MNNPTPNTPIRVLIAEDHPIMRQGLGVVLDAYDDLVLVGEAENGKQAVQLAQDLEPDVIVMDIQMPVKDGLDAIREITGLRLETRILVLTSYPDDDKVFQAIKAGAMGYFLKETRSEQLAEAIRLVQRGEAALSPAIARKLMQEIKEPTETTSPEEALTPREMEILRYLARGFSNQEIADELEISITTVATHVRNILSKLHLANRTQAALYAIEQGISPSEQG
jgi:NarL family two-component system response regulator LiaR